MVPQHQIILPTHTIKQPVQEHKIPLNVDMSTNFKDLLKLGQ